MANRIAKILDEYFPHPDVPLTHSSPYTLLIAVLLSAQSTDKRVNTVTPHLFAKASTPEEMMQFTPQEIEPIIRPCGLFRTKSRAIVALSQQLVKKYRGRVPRTLKSLEKLPGVGHKTASVVMVQAFHKPAFPVDTHIFRCAHRWGLSKGKTREKVEEDLKKLFPKKRWGKVHLQIIYFARSFCPARGHKVNKCPICSELDPATRRSSL